MASSILRRNVLIHGSRQFLQSRRHGYIVLVPEVSSDLPEKHSMSRSDEGFPTFSQVNGEQYIATLGKLTLEYETDFWKLEEQIKTAEDPLRLKDVIFPLEKLALPLEAAWGVLKTLSLVETKQISPESYIKVHDRARRARSKRFHSSAIYQAIKPMLVEMKTMSEERQRLMTKFILEGKLNGLELDPTNQQRFLQILNHIGQEKAKFRGKLEVATKNFKQLVSDHSVVRDFPQDFLQSTAKDSTKFSQGPWTFTLDDGTANKFMQYCPMRELRWNIWQASVRRCSNDGEKLLSTSGNIEQLRALRKEQAQLTGFNSYVELSMQTKMAANEETVRSMIATLLLKAFPAQEMELAQLQKFANERGFDDELKPWDVAYWKRKQQRSICLMTEDEMRPYFPLSRVLEGLFQVTEKLFQLEILEDTEASTWHPDCKFYHLRTTEGKLLGGFYFDPYSRSGEKVSSSIGWMVGMRGRNLSAPGGGLPLASLVFNFPTPQENIPCCLSFDQIQYLFQKFGHMLQHVVASAECSEVAGLNNMEWDAVGISSHFFAMWLQDINTLRSLSGHYENGAPLGESQLESLSQIHRHMAGYNLCKELYLATLDLELHSRNEFWLEIVRKLYPKFSTFELDKRDAHPCSFSPIFSGDWAAAYYSTIWSKMVAADSYSAFLEAPDQVESTGKRFRETLLEPGGACHPAVAFRRFRGRDPSPNALLKSLGLKSHKTTSSNKKP